MILGIGTDLVDARRIQKLLNKYPKRFPKKLCTPLELKNIPGRPDTAFLSYAKRFAAKEAVAKACGVGISAHLSFQDIQVSHGLGGKPTLTLSAKVIQTLWPHLFPDQIQLDLSLADDYPYVQSFVIISQPVSP